MNSGSLRRWLVPAVVVWAIPAAMMWAGIGILLEHDVRQRLLETARRLDRELEDWVERVPRAREARLNRVFDGLVGRRLARGEVASAAADLLGPFQSASTTLRLFDGRGRMLVDRRSPDDAALAWAFGFVRRPWSEDQPLTVAPPPDLVALPLDADLLARFRGCAGVLLQITQRWWGCYRWQPGPDPEAVAGVLVFIDDRDGRPIRSMVAESMPVELEAGLVAGFHAGAGCHRPPAGWTIPEFDALIARSLQSALPLLVDRGHLVQVKAGGAEVLLVMAAPRPRPAAGMVLAIFVAYAVASFQLLGWLLRLSGGHRRVALPLWQKLAGLFAAAGAFPLAAAAVLGHLALAETRTDLAVTLRKEAYARLEALDAGLDRHLADRELTWRGWMREFRDGTLDVASFGRLIDDLQARHLLKDAFLVSSHSEILLFDYAEHRPELLRLLALPVAERLAIVERLVRSRADQLSVTLGRVLAGHLPLSALEPRIPQRVRDRVRRLLPQLGRDCIGYANQIGGFILPPAPHDGGMADGGWFDFDGGTVFQLIKLQLGQIARIPDGNAFSYVYADVITDRRGEGQMLLVLSLGQDDLERFYLETALATGRGRDAAIETRAVVVHNAANWAFHLPMEDDDPFVAIAIQMAGEGRSAIERAVPWRGTMVDAVLLRGRRLAGYVLVDVTRPEALQARLAPVRQRIATGMAGVLVVSVLLGWLMLRGFLFPVQELVRGVAALETRRFHDRILVDSDDELGQLCALMNRTLAQLADMQLAESVQRTLYPQEPLRIGDYEIIGRNRMTQSIGGDCYDFFPLPDGKVAIVLADVTGHGLSAALVTAMAKAAFAIICPRLPDDPVAAMARCNEHLFTLLARMKMMTAQLLLLDPSTGRLSIANAGQLSPLLVGPTGEVRAIDLPSMPMGFQQRQRYAQTVIDDWAGAVVLLTDGLVEALGPDGKPVNFERLQRAVSEALADRAADPTEAIFARIERLTHPVPWSDDATVVVIRRLGEPTPGDPAARIGVHCGGDLPANAAAPS